MLKVMILDDETIARIGLLHSIDWEENGYCIVGEACSIQDAISVCLTQKPDIILVDIILRNENGLSFIEQIQPQLPLAKFILVTCTDDSEFYRKAISLHVSEFISKAEMTTDELLSKLEKVSAEISRERIIDPVGTDNDTEYINRYTLLNSYMNQYLMQKEHDPQSLERRLFLNGIHIQSSGYTIICLKKITPAAATRKNANFAIITLCSEILSELAEGYVFLDYQGHIIIFIVQPQHILSSKMLKGLCYRMITTIYECICVNVIAGISEKTLLVGDFFKAWQQAVSACGQYFFLESESIFFYHDAKDQNTYITKVEAQKEFILKIHSISTPESIYEHLNIIHDILVDYPFCHLVVIRNIYLDILNHLLNIAGISIINFSDYTGGITMPYNFIEEAQNLHELNEALRTLLYKILYRDTSSVPDELISLINNYVNENLEKNIMLIDIANHVHYTQSHISKYYKKKTGVNLKDYILDCKIQKAIQMLENGISINSVASTLSFCSTSHFIQTFKSRTGKTPNKYIDILAE